MNKIKFKFNDGTSFELVSGDIKHFEANNVKMHLINSNEKYTTDKLMLNCVLPRDIIEKIVRSYMINLVAYGDKKYKFESLIAQSITHGHDLSYLGFVSASK